MKRKLILILVASLLLATPVLAQISANYDLSWHVVAGGGGKMQGSGYNLQGTLGQPLTGPSSGSSHSLNSGYWSGLLNNLPPPGHPIYLPIILGGS
jgi:hypothetical protein